MDILKKATVRQVFKDHGIQLGSGAIETIDDDISRRIDAMAKRCKDGNIKRLTPDLFWIALGKYNLDR